MAFTNDEISEIIEEFMRAVGTRQYIGSRYVPILGRKGETSVQWDNSEPYEPLTIVLHNGDSYTSRQYVPAGVDISDELYWAHTGNYNAQIEQYRSAVNALSDDVSELDTRVTETQSAVTDEETARTAADNTLQANIDAEESARTAADTTLQANIDAEEAARTAADTTLQANIDAEEAARIAADNTINERVDGVVNGTRRKAIYVGNSYAIGTGSTGNNNGMYARTRSFFDESELIWVSSVGFKTYDTVNSSFLTMITQKANSMTDTERAEITDIVVISAVGDDRIIVQEGDNALYEAINAFCDYVNVMFPNAHISVISCSSSSKAGNGDVTPSTMYALHQRFIKCSNLNGFTYLGLAGYIIAHANANFSADGYHPSDTGYNYMANAMLHALKTGHILYPVRKSTVYMTNGTKTMPFVMKQVSPEILEIKPYATYEGDSNFMYEAGSTIPISWSTDISASDGAVVYDNTISNAEKGRVMGMARVAPLNASNPVYVPFTMHINSNYVLNFNLRGVSAAVPVNTTTYFWPIGSMIV